MKRLLWIGLIAALPVFAEEPATPPGEDWELLRIQAKGLRDHAKQMRSDAEQKVEASKTACWDKVLVSACMEDAREAMQQAKRESNRVDLEALAIERRVQAHDREVKQEKRAAKFREREAQASQRAEKIRLEDEARQRKEAERAAREEQHRQKAAQK